MTIVLFVVFLFGIVRCRYWAYWKWALALLAWTVVGVLIGAGPLQDAAYSPLADLILIAYAVVVFGGVLVLIWRLYRAFQVSKTKQHEDGAGTIEARTVSKTRMTLEIVFLCLVMLGYAFFYFT